MSAVVIEKAPMPPTSIMAVPRVHFDVHCRGSDSVPRLNRSLWKALLQSFEAVLAGMSLALHPQSDVVRARNGDLGILGAVRTDSPYEVTTLGLRSQSRAAGRRNVIHARSQAKVAKDHC